MIAHEGRARRNTITSQNSEGRPSEDAGHAGIGTKRFRGTGSSAPPLPPDSAVKIEAARRNGVTPYGPSLGSGPAHVVGDLKDEPAVMRMLELESGFVSSPSNSPDLHRGPSTGGVHFQQPHASGSGRKTPDGRRTPDASMSGRRTPDVSGGRRTPDPLRSGTPDPNNPGTYVLRVPAPAGSATAVPRRVVSPPLSRTPTPTRRDWKSTLAGSAGEKTSGESSRAVESSRFAPESSRAAPESSRGDGDEARVPRMSAASSSTSVRAQPAVSEYFPPQPAHAPLPRPSSGDGSSEYGDALTGLAPPPPLGMRSVSGFARSDRATVADSTWVPSPDIDDGEVRGGGREAGEVQTGRAVLSMEGAETVTSEGVEVVGGSEAGEGSESAASGHALLKRHR